MRKALTMGMKGKKKYTFYLEEENVEFLRAHFIRKRDEGGLSGFIDKYLERAVWIAKANHELYEKIPSKKFTFKGFWNLLKIQYRLQEERENCEIESRK